MDVISKLQRNPKQIYQEAVRLLTKIAENILHDPSNKKLRTLQKSNPTISKKILSVFGGIECLILMGFEEVCMQIRFTLYNSVIVKYLIGTFMFDTPNWSIFG